MSLKTLSPMRPFVALWDGWGWLLLLVWVAIGFCWFDGN